jgi:hypothetical protein
MAFKRRLPSMMAPSVPIPAPTPVASVPVRPPNNLAPIAGATPPPGPPIHRPGKRKPGPGKIHRGHGKMPPPAGGKTYPTTIGHAGHLHDTYKKGKR